MNKKLKLTTFLSLTLFLGGAHASNENNASCELSCNQPNKEISHENQVEYPSYHTVWSQHNKAINHNTESHIVDIKGTPYNCVTKIDTDSDGKPCRFHIKILAHSPDNINEEVSYYTPHGRIEGIFYDNVCYIQLLHVNWELRHKGVGEYLVKKVFSIAQENNLSMVLWQAQPFDTDYPQGTQTAMDRLVTWYKKLGGTTPRGVSPSITPMLYVINNAITNVNDTLTNHVAVA